MKDIIPAKKESPLLGLTGLGGGVGSNLGGSAADPVYVDEIFNTKCYIGNATERTINTGIDLAGEGGLLWFKNRDNSNQAHYLNDTTSLPQSSSPWYSYPIFSNSTTARGASANGLKSFNSDGFTIQTDTHCNGNGNYQVAWSFRKQKGFFDIVTWSGNGTGGREIAHDLGSVPGCIMIKCTSHGQNWQVYHRGIGAASALFLDLNNAKQSGSHFFNDVEPTATNFTLGTDAMNNASGYDYVAYVFAGGESPAATAKSVYFDGTDDTLTLGSSPTPSYDDFHMTGDFTIESWIYPTDWNNAYSGLWGLGQYNDPGGIFFGVVGSSGKLDMQKANNTGGGYNTPFSVTAPPKKQWTHVALVRAGSTITVYYNGTAKGSWTDSTDWGTSTNKCFNVGSVRNGSGNNVDFFKGQISNMRVVKGTAVYTTAFRPPIKTLTNITNTKLLCCNNSSATGSTVTPGTITAVSSPTVFTDSPFDDPDAFTFGEGGDQQIVKCGLYQGFGSERYIDIGFEPQWILIKKVDTSSNWVIADDMRGAADKADNDQKALFPNLEQSDTSGNYIGMTARGIKLLGGESSTNTSNEPYIYMAIRRPDGLVGKPIETGTDAFTLVYGKNDNTLPTFVSPHVTDFTLFKNPASGSSWYTQERIHGKGFMIPSGNDSEANSGNNTWDFSDGFYKATGNWSTDTAWMWKRYAGFDIVNWNGNGEVTRHVHNLGQAPEFMIVKRRSATEDWTCYHKGLNGGTNPSHYYIQLNGTSGEGTYTNYEPGNPGNYNLWNREDPTSAHITIGEHDRVNSTGQTYMALLFSSVTGVSKVGYYDGSGSDITITTGFQPRFVIIKAANNTRGWTVMDTLRGWGAGVDNKIYLNDNGAQVNTWNYGEPTSTGFTVSTGQYDINYTGWKYIYYAHA